MQEFVLTIQCNMVFSSPKVANIDQQGKWALWFIYIWLLTLVSRVSAGRCRLSAFDLIRQIVIRAAQSRRVIGASFRLWTDIANLISFAGNKYQLILQMKHLIYKRNL